MEMVVPIETDAGRTVLVHGSYRANFRLDDTLVVSEQANNARATGASVLPAMRVLPAVQDDRDRCFGAPPLPGRPPV